MSNIIYKVNKNRIRAHTIFRSTLTIYEDYIVFWNRFWLTTKEITITYKQIAQVNITKGIWFSRLHIISSGGYEEAEIKCVLNKKAIRAKRIIEQKLHRSHAPTKQRKEFKHKKIYKIDKLEKSLNRLRELVNKGKLTEREYEKKRKKMLKSIE